MADYASQTFLNQKINLPHTHFKIGVVTALWNSEITSKLKAGALKTLTEAGIPSENIKVGMYLDRMNSYMEPTNWLPTDMTL